MAASGAKQKPSSVKGTVRKTKVAMSREQRAVYGEIKQGVRHLEKSIGELQRGLLKAEKRIEADARLRIRDLRRDARTQLGLLKSKRQEAARIVKNVSVAAGGSWKEIKQSADAIFADARGTAASVVDRLRKAITS
jgi:hypothetical protein